MIEKELNLKYNIEQETLKRSVYIFNRNDNSRNYKAYYYREEYNKTYKSKYILDLALSLIAFPILILIFPFVYFGIKLSSSGPVIFKQPRIGLHGKRFYCYKFRTMHIDKDHENNSRCDKNSELGLDKPIITKKDDPRLFAFGKFLRKSNIDEFPQIINVLKKEMSFVGPRPYTIDETDYWDEKLDDFYLRYKSRPGISGYAQVMGYRGGNLDETHMCKRLDFDLKYFEKSTLMFDLKVVGLTILHMLRLKTMAH